MTSLTADRVYNRREAAAAARVSTRTLDRARAAGQLLASRPSPRRVVIRGADLLAWLERTTTPTP